MKLLFATQNRHKQHEIAQLLTDPTIEVLFPDRIESIRDLDVDETGSSFEENALLKASQFSDKTGLLTVAEDSGLEVQALNGQPGIYSKRYAPGSDTDRNQKLLLELAEAEDRSARFVATLCLYQPAENEHIFFEGVVTGRIAHQLQGDQGFGYDPVFIPDGYDQSFAELGQDVKNSLSHRRRALIKLHTYLLQESDQL